MKFHRIYASILRHIYLFRHSLNRLGDAFYWPTIDLLLWGLTMSYAKTFSNNSEQLVLMVISGIILWLIVWRAQYEITVSLLEDLWNRNMINMYVSPFKLSEWIVSVIILGLIKAFVSLSFAAGVAYLLYRVKFFAFGFSLIPIALLLFMTGWWVGFFVAGLLLRYGTKVEQFAWSLVHLISPFAAVYYPLSILPGWAQKIAMLIPVSYVFEAAREVLNKGILDPNKLIISFVLNIIYLILSLIFLKKSFDKVLDKGLVKVF